MRKKQYQIVYRFWITVEWDTTLSSYTYTKNCDEPIHGRNLKTRNTCKVTSSEECHIKQDNLVNKDLLEFIATHSIYNRK